MVRMRQNAVLWMSYRRNFRVFPCMFTYARVFPLLVYSLIWVISYNNMKCVGLISGGKDSCYNLMQCVGEGHQIVALANLKPKDKDELDSYMYQSVGHHVIELYAEALDLPLYRREISGTSKATDRDYTPTNDDEVEDLYELLKEIKTKEEIEAVSVGAILSNYQRVRVENVCQRLSLVPLAYLWRRDQTELLDEMIQCKLEAILIKVAAMGLKPKVHLGKSLSEMREYLHKMNEEFELNVCGEGGEYETFTLDCPLFKKKIVLDETELVIHSDDAFAPVGYLNLRRAHLEDKNLGENLTQEDLLNNLPLQKSVSLLDKLFPDKSLLRCNQCEHLQNLPYHDEVKEMLQPTLRRMNKDSEKQSFIVSNLIGLNCGNKDVTNIAKQTMDSLKNCILPLEMSSIVLVHLYVRNMEDFATVNSVYKTYFGINPASRVCVEANLPQNVSLMLDCYGNSDCSNRETMHVQGLSHWAPANIGPYSQCVKVGDTYYIAGQIGMVPANLSLIDGGVRGQARLSIQHVCSVLKAMCPTCEVHNIVCCVCYVTHPQYITVAKEELEREKTWDLACVPVYVVVPRLPKGALVEWQVIMKTNLSKPLKVERDTKCSGSILTSTARMYRSSSSKPCSLVVSVYSNMTSDITVSMVMEQLRDYKVMFVDNKQGEEQSDNGLTIVRIFYKADMFQFIELKTEVEKFYNDAVVLIPVVQLETEDTALTLSQTYIEN